ncbi:MAG: tRNA (adenosine(37)-N6)-threonylcarbamoyltransferase complex dimerization subunit type 1 TsaB [Desulfobacterales bacterium]|nr:tRNA (adenosine(37)-N6)-threonylcarbamoyltransferase complex dimerization subunit type 1 TsaB [Desulfobacterales bacterium]
MKILAVDTATRSCSVAIVENSTLLAELTLANGRTHSTHLMGMVESAVKMSGLTVSDIDGFAVARGPGSFTGLRIGISAVKGFAAATGKPLVGVSTLDALAFQFPFSSYLVCPLLDARRREVYYSQYRFEDGELKKVTGERILAPGITPFGIKEKCMFVGDGALVYKKVIVDEMGGLAHFAASCQNTIRAAAVAHLALKRFCNNDTDDVAGFQPTYIRKSDAELP